MKHLLSFFLAVLAVCSCTDSYETQQRIDREKQRKLQREDSLALKVAVMPTLDCLPIYVAADLRLFDTLGVDIRPKLYRAQMDCDEAMRAGRVEGMVSDLVHTERLKLTGMPLDYVTSTGTYWQMVANGKARLKRLDQMGDKIVAMTRFSATDYLSDTFLDGVKTSAQVFRVQINDVQIRYRMLLEKEVDAAWLAEPLATAARRHGNVVVADSRDKLLTLGVVAFRQKAVADNHRQKQLRAFVKAYNMACDSINKNGLKAYSGVLEKYYDVDVKTVAALPKSKFLHVTKPRKADVDKAATFAATTMKKD